MVSFSRFAQGVAPGADDAGDAALERLALDLGRCPSVAADNEMRPCERPFRVGGIGRGGAPFVDPRKELADAPADLAVVAVLRNEDEHRHEAVELVDARERADARPLGEIHDVDGEAVERFLVDLEKLVARIVFENVEESAAGVARRIESGAGNDFRHLVPQIGHLARHARIGARREQPDDAQLAFEPAILAEKLDADIVEIGAPMHARLDVGLGDDERVRALEEGAHFRRHDEEILAAAQDAHGRIAHQAEPRPLDRIGGRVARRKAVFAQAEESEVAVFDPFQEGDRLGDLVGRKRRRVRPVVPRQLADAGAHVAPVLHRDGNVGIDVAQGLGEALARLRRVDAVEMDMNEAFAPRLRIGRGGGLAQEPGEGPGSIALRGKDRMRDEHRLVALHRRSPRGSNRAGTAYCR